MIKLIDALLERLVIHAVRFKVERRMTAEHEEEFFLGSQLEKRFPAGQAD